MLETNSIPEGWKIPDWFLSYRSEILGALMPKDIIDEYTTYHDCSKPYCIEYVDGKKHFPNHAELSYKTWLEAGGRQEAANLMRMDMKIHTMKSNDIEEFISYSQCITLLVAGLAEIHSNAQMFGGIDSTSFKIKWKHINKIGYKMCKAIWG